jgi:hypothetical protein
MVKNLGLPAPAVEDERVRFEAGDVIAVDVVAGMCGELEIRREELAGDQVGIGDLPRAHRNIDAFLHEVDEPIREDQVERNVRVALEEAHELVKEKHAAEVARGGDPDRAAWLGRALLDRRNRGIQDIDGVDHRIVEAGALRGGCDAPGIAMDQLGAELLLEPAQTAAHRRFRHLEMPGSGSEAVATNYLDKCCNIVSIGPQSRDMVAFSQLYIN